MLLLAGAASGEASSASSGVTVAPPPAWVDELPLPDPDGRGDGAPTGIRYLVDDHQVRATGPDIEDYTRQVRRVDSAAGLQDISEVEVDFDPSYQRLLLHHIRLLRAGGVIDALRRDDVDVIHKESGRDERLYDGTLTAVLFLRDLRVGDTIDVAYTVAGSNPILGGRYAASLGAGFDSPVARVRHRLLWPAGRPIGIRAHGATTLQPRVERTPAADVYVWEASDLPAVPYEDDTPAGFDAYPWIQVSDFATWAEVAAWAEPLFRERTLSPELLELVEAIRKQHASDETRALAAIRFVQDEVRYLGIEMGEGSYRPHPPAQVYAQRFGDCKDKTLLLVAMLAALGVEADPVLVSTHSDAALDGWLPAPFAFDHVVTRARIAGETCWIDGTVSHEGGGIGALASPLWLRPLVVGRDTTDLLRLEAPPLPGPSTRVVERFHAVRYGGEAHLETQTIYTGVDADDARKAIASSTLDEIVREDLNRYARTDPSVEPEGTATVEDDREKNVLTLTERFVFPRFWRSRTRELLAWLPGGELERPRVLVRKSPLAVAHPVWLRHEVEVEMPEEAALAPVRHEVRGSAFEYRTEVASKGRRVRLAAEYRTLRDHVLPAELTAHLDHLREARGLLVFEVTAPAANATPLRGSADFPRWVPWALVGALLASLGYAAARRPRRREPPPGALAFAFAPGEAPSSAVLVRDEREIEGRLLRARCGCGRERQPRTSRSSVLYDGQSMTVVTRTCGTCGTERNVYFRIGGGSPGP